MSHKPEWVWLTVSLLAVAITGYLDWITGYELSFYAFYFIPICIAARYVGTGGAIIISLLSTIVWLWLDILSGHTYSSDFHVVWDTMLRIVSFLAIGWPLSKLKEALEREQSLTLELRRSIAQNKVLESFLPICCRCKKIRNKENQWQEIETYITTHTDSTFSHGYCPDCARKTMEEAGLQ